MDDDKIIETVLRLTDKIEANTTALREMLANHEARITVLETSTKRDDGWQSQLLVLLAKALVIGAVAIGSLAGAGGLLSKIMGI